MNHLHCWISLFSLLDYLYFIFEGYKLIISEKRMQLKLRESIWHPSQICEVCAKSAALFWGTRQRPQFCSRQQHPLSTSEIWSIFFWKSHGVFELHDWEWFWKMVLGSLVCFLKSFENTNFRKANRKPSRRINSSVFLRKNNYNGSFKALKEAAEKCSPELCVTADLAVMLENQSSLLAGAASRRRHLCTGIWRLKAAAEILLLLNVLRDAASAVAGADEYIWGRWF